MTDHPVELDPIDTEGDLDHPDELTDQEADQGYAAYLAVDDLEDESGGDPE